MHPLSQRIADVLDLQPDSPAIEYDGRWLSWDQIGAAAWQ
ncbi:MAG: long-chain acyl-CoA synthetase, partial [Mycobacterium sp.]|nr:long-chain acyl-CoA synthetase [Mycobacterium sp.]